MYDLWIARRNKCTTNSLKKVSNDKYDVVEECMQLRYHENDFLDTFSCY